MSRKILCAMLAVLCCLSLFSCLKTDTNIPGTDNSTSDTTSSDEYESGDSSSSDTSSPNTPETGDDSTSDSSSSDIPDPGDDDEKHWSDILNGTIFTSSNEDNVKYLSSYGDMDMAEAWTEKNIILSSCPPVNFIIDGTNSDNLTWTVTSSDITKVVDYPDSDAKERAYYTLTYACEEYDVAVEVVVTMYPDFPIIEYEATLINTSKKTSAEIKDLNCIDKNIYPTEKDVTLRYYTGASKDGSSDYSEKIKTFSPSLTEEDNTFKIEVTNGKPTSTYLPDFSIEQEGGDGVIALLSWQGSWRSEFKYDTESGIHMTAGQYETDFNLLKGETHRFPATVLIFYKDSYVYGQNIYRRWFYQHNYMRENKEKMGQNIPLVVSPVGENFFDMQSDEKNDLSALAAVEKFGFDLFTHFHQDAGWYKYNSSQTWYESVGTWETADPIRYPNGLKKISERAAELGLGYSVWIDTETVNTNTTLAAKCKKYLIFGTTASGTISNNCLINIGIPEACDIVLETVNKVIKDSGATIYRQDFNTYPAAYWSKYDAKQEKTLKILRTGRTEEQYCNGYLRLLDGILEANDGIIIDTCASGGMRYDLATARRSYCLQRSDFTWDAEKNQSDTYVSSKWMICWGTTFGDDQGYYGMRSKLALALTVGVPGDNPNFDYESYFTRLNDLLSHWKDINSYTFEDYYPLTEFIAPDDLGVLAMQYDCPTSDNGMIVTYVRGTGLSETLYPYALDPDATYKWYDADDAENVHTATGKELMENGVTVVSGTPETDTVEAGLVSVARLFIYEKVN